MISLKDCDVTEIDLAKEFIKVATAHCYSGENVTMYIHSGLEYLKVSFKLTKEEIAELIKKEEVCQP